MQYKDKLTTATRHQLQSSFNIPVDLDDDLGKCDDLNAVVVAHVVDAYVPTPITHY